MNRRVLVTISMGIAIFLSSVRADYETVNLFGGIGVGFGTGGTHYRSVESDNKITDRFFNYGSGFKLDIGSQYRIADEVALQGSFGYSIGTGFEVAEGATAITTTTTYKRHMFGLRLHCIPRFQVLDLLDMYAGVGIGCYWASCPFEISVETTATKQEAQGKITSSPSLGFSGLLGTDYPYSDKITFFGEIGFEQISFMLSKYKIEKSTIPTLETGTVYNYEKNAAGTNNLPPEKVPGSNIQLRIGIRYAIK